jgi:hypothetical protein
MRGVKENLKPNAYKQWEPRSPEVSFGVIGSPLASGVTAYLLYNGSASWSYERA